MRGLALLLLLAGSWCAVAATIESNSIRVEYPPGNEALAQKSHNVLVAAQREFAKRLPKSPDQLRVVICDAPATFKELAGPLSTFSIVGVALPNKDLIVLKSPSLTPPGADYEGTLRHELIHILLEYNLNTDQLPRWLNEGLAMVLSGENRWESRTLVAQMYLDGRILRYRDLEASFLDPGQEQQFGDAYAQSYSMTQYLMQRLGEERFWKMLGTLQTRSFGDALESEAGALPYDFWAEWKESLGKTALVVWIVSGASVLQLTALLTIWAYWRKHRRGKRVIEAWDEEEREQQPDIPPAE